MSKELLTIITGGSGMVGQQCGDRSNSNYLSSLDLDLKKKKKIDKYFGLYSPDFVIHAAAKVGGVGINLDHQAEFLYDNIIMNSNVIEACRVHNVRRACFFLSTCVFPDKIEYPLTEEKIHLGPGHPSNYGYSESKRAMEIMVRAYNEQYGTNYFCVIPCNVYGPGDNFNLKSGHVIPSLIHKCFLARENNKDLHIWGDGTPLREFVYSKDLARITNYILYNTNFKGNVIISNQEEISINDVATKIAKYMGFKGKIIFDKVNQGQFRKPSSIEKLKTIVPPDQLQFTSFDKGLEETINWFEKHYPNVRK